MHIIVLDICAWLRGSNVPSKEPWVREIVERTVGEMMREIERGMQERRLLIRDVTDWSDAAVKRRRQHSGREGGVA